MSCSVWMQLTPSYASLSHSCIFCYFYDASLTIFAVLEVGTRVDVQVKSVSRLQEPVRDGGQRAAP